VHKRKFLIIKLTEHFREMFFFLWREKNNIDVEIHLNFYRKKYIVRLDYLQRRADSSSVKKTSSLFLFLLIADGDHRQEDLSLFARANDPVIPIYAE